MVYPIPSASHHAYRAGTANPLSARSSIGTPGQRARTPRTTRLRTATTPWLPWAFPGRSTAVMSWSVSPSKRSRGKYMCWR